MREISRETERARERERERGRTRSRDMVIIYRFLYWVSIFNYGVCSVFEVLAYEGTNGTTNPAVVDLSPYGFVCKVVLLQTLILN